MEKAAYSLLMMANVQYTALTQYVNRQFMLFNIISVSNNSVRSRIKSKASIFIAKNLTIVGPRIKRKASIATYCK